MWLFYHKYRLRKKSSWNATLKWENGRGKKIVNCLFAIIQFTQVICRHRLFERFVMRNYIFNFYPVPVRYFWTEFSRVGSSLIFPYPIKARFPSRLIHTNCCWASCALHLEKRLNPRSLEFLSFLWTTTLSILFYQRSVYKKIIDCVRVVSKSKNRKMVVPCVKVDDQPYDDSEIVPMNYFDDSQYYSLRTKIVYTIWLEKNSESSKQILARFLR